MAKILLLFILLTLSLGCVRSKSLEVSLSEIENSQHHQSPTDISLTSSSLAENAGVNAAIGTLSTTDADAIDAFTYTLVSGTGSTDNGSFNISGNQLRGNASFDYETKNSYSVRVRSTDAGGLYTEKQFTISLTNVNEAPVASDLTPTTGYTGLAKTITLSYIDPDSDQASGCNITNLVNMTVTTACSCAVGVCTVGVTPAAEGVVSFDYTVSAGSLTSNSAHASVTALIGLNISDIIVNEWGVASLNITLTAASGSPVTVDYVTSDVGGTATAGTDYISSNSTLTIPAGVTSKVISVPIFSNRTKQSNRDFFVNLSNAANSGLVNSSAKVTIVDDEYAPMQNVIKVSTGWAHACALLSTTGVMCWGNDNDGQLGDNTSGGYKLLPTSVSGLGSGVSDISLGNSHSCALMNTGAVKCWGINDAGQIGDNTAVDRRLIPTDVSGLSSGVIAISAGGNHSCALLSTGAVKCWGYNNFGQIGDNTSGTFRHVPTDVSGLSSGVIAISAGGNHSCALLSTGAVKCWGNNDRGQIGDNTSGTNRLVPTAVSGLSSGVHKVSAGGYHSCARLTSGAAKCWGYNYSGAIGDNTSGTDRLVPTDVSGLGSGVMDILAGSGHTCALLTTGAVKCWGSNLNGQVGDMTLTDRLVPTDVMNLSSGVTSIAIGYAQACALLSGGFVKCWGSNNYGQMGDNTRERERQVPTDVSGLSSGVVRAAAGSSHTCALLTTGAVKCWGTNQNGQLGDNSTITRLLPIDVSGLSSGVTAIATGGAHTCALLSTGAVKCWGNNMYGQIGDNSTTYRYVPTDVTGLSSGVSAITTGTAHTCALLSTGAVKCWGFNYYGQIGDNTSGMGTEKKVPTDVSSLTSGVVQVSAGDNHTCAILSTGALKCWGRNLNGQVGDNSVANRTVPTAVSGLSSNVSFVSAGINHTCALLSTGAVKCWGQNNQGQIGDNTSGVDRLVPTDVLSLNSSVSGIAAGYTHSCALLSTGGVKCWGDNSMSQLGDTTMTQRLVPTEVSGLSSGVSLLTNSYNHTCAILNAGGLKCWGFNDSNRSGDSYINIIPQFVVSP